MKFSSTLIHCVPIDTSDSRNIPALGRIGDPDDIIASVRVEEGKVSLHCLMTCALIFKPFDGQILHETYQPMPSYRLCTSDGVMQLTEGLFARLKETLETRTREEDS